MIYLIGDIHGTSEVYKLLHFLKGNRTGLMTLDDVEVNITPEHIPTEKDYVIILGDAGIYWDNDKNDKKMRLYLNECKPIILWLDGNHENFDLIDALPVVEKFGGKVGYVPKKMPNVYHLMRGEIYTIEDKTFFVMGGGLSIDKAYRTAGKSWWSREMPSAEEYENAEKNLEKYGNKVDYILTHTCPRRIVEQLVYNVLTGEEELQYKLGDYAAYVDFKHWYFGHWHMDVTIDKFTCLYNDIVALEK